MKKSVLLLNLFILLSINIESHAQSNDIFPDSHIGQFASRWFEAVNKNDVDILSEYGISKDGWDDYFDTLAEMFHEKGGLTPYAISFFNQDKIGVYAKEGERNYVIVLLEHHKSENEILEMSVKKSFMAVDYPLSSNMTSEQVIQILEAVNASLIKDYVLPEKAKLIVSRIKKNMAKYSGISQGDYLARIFSKDLKVIANDKHLQLIPPSMKAEVVSRFGIEEKVEKASQAEKDSPHMDISETIPIIGEIIEGNIGYVRLEKFVDSEEVKKETERVMNNVKNTKALIFDLTQSGGGDGNAVLELFSYLFKKETKLSDDGEMIIPNEYSQFFSDKPLYVLTSAKSISAAEAFAYHLKKMDKAKLVGQKTAGAGYLVNVFELPFGFYLVNSTDAKYKENEGWQGKGVLPDFEVSPRDARSKAIALINKSK